MHHIPSKKKKKKKATFLFFKKLFCIVFYVEAQSLAVRTTIFWRVIQMIALTMISQGGCMYCVQNVIPSA